MSDIKERHPSWFKMKLERRELIRQLSPETAVNVLLACWDFLETGEKPAGLSPIESVAFASFMPDMDEAWERYLTRISSGAKGGRPKKPYGSICPHTAPYGTEEETEPETDTEEDSNRERADKPPRSRFVPPSVDEVRAYCAERQNGVDADCFVDFYTANGWKQSRGKSIVDWKAAIRTWEKRETRPKGGDEFADVI